MDQKKFSRPLDLRRVKIEDPFWQHEQELVRREVIPYQWKALNDQVPGAEPSWCMHNFRSAAGVMARGELQKYGYDPEFGKRPFDRLPENGVPDPNAFYGFVFQDTDFSKWIEAVGYSLTVHPDAELEAVADQAIETVCAAQAPDGYLDTCYILGGMAERFTRIKDHHELYCLGHLVEGAVSYYEATGKDRLLKAACRFADCVDSRIGPEEGKLHAYPGHEIAEMALVRLWNVTKNDRYLKLARYFVDERGKAPNYFEQEAGHPVDAAYHQADRPVREQTEAVGHAVRAMYLYSGMADIARVTGDESLLAACERLWHSAVEEKMYITGGVGGTKEGEAFSFPFDLPNDSAYSETCAAIGLVFFARRMLEIRADSRYGDVMERALYNTVLDGMALDGRSFFYVNPLEVLPEAAHRDVRLNHVKPVRQKWFGCACCPPNIARLVSSLGMYAFTESDDTFYVHLYLGGTVRTTLNGVPVTLELESRLPWAGSACVTVHTKQPVQGTLAFRVPDWSFGSEFITFGKKSEMRSGYEYLTGVWHDGDMVDISLPMRVMPMRAARRVREDAGLTAVQYGPVVYCGEEADNGAQLQDIRLDPSRVEDSGVFTVDEDTFGRPVGRIDLPATRVTTADEGLYGMWRPGSEKNITLHLIPYFTFANRGEGEMRVWWH